MFSINVERAWLNEPQIAFVGSLTDVSSHDADNYLVEIGSGPFQAAFVPKPRLQLVCPRAVVDPVIAKGPTDGLDLFAGVAVACIMWQSLRGR